MVFSADKRSEPIFAFSETGVFSENAVTLNGIKDFITMAKEKVKLAKTMKNIPPKEKALWERFEGKIPLKKSSKTSFWCDYEYYSNNTGSYVSNVAQWHQGSLAAFYMDTEVSCGNCDRKEAGCGNISMGQIMRFYQYPQGTLCYNGDCLTLNYNSMPQYSTALVCGTTPPDELRQISILMRNLFITNNSGYIGCQTFTYPWNIPAAFSNYGYSNGGIKENYNDVVFSKVKPDLKNYHPVIFSGTLNPFNMLDAHIWVGDGWFDYYSVYPDGYYDEDGNFIFTNCNYYYGDMISLNWGWEFGDGNGFYNIFYFNSPQGLYDTYLKVITGIRP